MSKLAAWAIELIGAALETSEKQAVLGDLAESGESGFAALLHILGLLVRRQLEPWQDWRPWIALIGIVGVVAVPLSQFSSTTIQAILQQLGAYWKFGVRVENGVSVGADLAHLTCLLTGVLVWSWMGSFVLGSLAGRATWLLGALFWLVTCDAFQLTLLLSGQLILLPRQSLLALLMLRPILSPAILMLPVVLWGSRSGVHRRVLNMRVTIGLAGVLALIAVLLVWMQGWYEAALQSMSEPALHFAPWYVKLLPILLVSWPITYLLATANPNSRKAAQ